GQDLQPADVDRPGPPFHVVLGNEACDVDSMVSALAFSYFLFKTAHGDTVPLPLLNIRRSELVLRSDNVFLLRQVGLSPELLLFRDQVDLRALRRAGRLRLTLVDHNVLPSSDCDLEDAVVEVIDHHHQERESNPTCPVTVETVGSCATLVTERILQKAPEILDQQLAQLLYGAMVLDCVNMDPAAGKVTPKDSQYAEALERRFPTLPPRGALFQSLQNAKFDVSDLNTEQMLLKDMKAVSGSLNVAISVLYITLEVSHHGNTIILRRYRDTHRIVRNVSGYVSYHQTLANTHPYCSQVSQYLEQSCSPALDLCPTSTPLPHVSAYHQGNRLASRKKLLPLVKACLREQHGGGALGPGEEESDVPPTPMNSLVEGCPLNEGLPQISVQDLQEKVSKLEAADL
uniref:Prune exopolyphosphatase n=1 Tax=Oryzias melastigma TaxID=30732 RepID=A0A3B3BN39_ORYME